MLRFSALFSGKPQAHGPAGVQMVSAQLKEFPGIEIDRSRGPNRGRGIDGNHIILSMSKKKIVSTVIVHQLDLGVAQESW